MKEEDDMDEMTDGHRLPHYKPMRAAGPDLRTARSWRVQGRYVRHGEQPVAAGWRHPGEWHGHKYGGWMPLYHRDQTKDTH